MYCSVCGGTPQLGHDAKCPCLEQEEQVVHLTDMGDGFVFVARYHGNLVLAEHGDCTETNSTNQSNTDDHHSDYTYE